MFQHTAARRRLGICLGYDKAVEKFQHTAARRRLEQQDVEIAKAKTVSTHSRPKAAGY